MTEKNEFQKKYYDKLENLFEYFYKEKGDIERCVFYNEIISHTPEIEEIWNKFKESIEEAHLIFEFKYKKILDRHK